MNYPIVKDLSRYHMGTSCGTLYFVLLWRSFLACLFGGDAWLRENDLCR